MIQVLSDPLFLFLAATVLVVFIVCITVAYGRHLRHLNIKAAGWPPPHVDADGDLRYEPEAEEE